MHGSLVVPPKAQLPDGKVRVGARSCFAQGLGTLGGGGKLSKAPYGRLAPTRHEFPLCQPVVHYRVARRPVVVHIFCEEAIGSGNITGHQPCARRLQKRPSRQKSWTFLERFEVEALGIGESAQQIVNVTQRV